MFVFKGSHVAFCLALTLVLALALTPLPAARGQGGPPDGSRARKRLPEQSENTGRGDGGSRHGGGDADDADDSEEAGGRADPCGHEPRGNAHGRRRQCPHGGSSSGVARGDFNGDGFADLAVGVPFEDVGSVAAAGAVNVIYGSADGLTAAGGGVPAAQFWHQDTPGIGETAEELDRFGSALAAGNFNGDEFSDLAIGVPLEDIGFSVAVGVIHVLYGSANGLTITGDQLIDPSVFRPPDAPRSEFFGSALAWADFNDDGFGDLAVAAATPTRGLSAVFILRGSPGGITPEAFEELDLPDDNFYTLTLAAGKLDGDQFADLVIGEPSRTVNNRSFAGAVEVIYGSASGVLVAANRRQLWHQDSATLLNDDGAESSDRFGSALAIGDFNGDGLRDLAIGAPGEDIGNVIGAGVVQVIYGDTFGLSATAGPGNQQWAQGSAGIKGTPEEGDAFGGSLAAGDFNGDGRSDLAVGAYLEDVVNAEGTNVMDAGVVNVIYGSAGGLRATGDQLWHQDSPDIKGEIEQGDEFGYSLTAWNFGRSARADLAIGVPFENVEDVGDAGAVNVIYGSSSGLTASGDQLWHQGSPGVPGLLEGSDYFGRALY